MASNRKTIVMLAGVGLSLLALGFASKPLYDTFCKVTGYGGTTRVAGDNISEVLDRKVRVSFDANNVNGFRATEWAELPKLSKCGGISFSILSKAAEPWMWFVVPHVSVEGREREMGDHKKKKTQTMAPNLLSVLMITALAMPVHASSSAHLRQSLAMAVHPGQTHSEATNRTRRAQGKSMKTALTRMPSSSPSSVPSSSPSQLPSTEAQHLPKGKGRMGKSKARKYTDVPSSVPSSIPSSLPSSIPSSSPSSSPTSTGKGKGHKSKKSRALSSTDQSLSPSAQMGKGGKSKSKKKTTPPPTAAPSSSPSSPPSKSPITSSPVGKGKKTKKEHSKQRKKSSPGKGRDPSAAPTASPTAMPSSAPSGNSKKQRREHPNNRGKGSKGSH